MANTSFPSRRTLLVSSLFCFALALSVGCSSCSSEDDIEKAAIIAAQIKKTPKKAKAILEEHDMTIEEFEKVMYDIAADPELSKQFEEARKKAN